MIEQEGFTRAGKRRLDGRPLRVASRPGLPGARAPWRVERAVGPRALVALLAVVALSDCSCRDKGWSVRALIGSEPLSLDFGTLKEGLSATQALTLRNDGRAALAISSIEVDGDGRGAFEVLDTVTRVEAGERVELRVQYTAPAGDGLDGAFLLIKSNAENTPSLQVGLQGRSSSACVPETEGEICFRLGKNCGPASAQDNCGVTRSVASCGACTSPQTCGAVTPGVCGCVPEADSALCVRLGKNCGPVTAPDNCGASRSVASCGVCAGTDVCGAVTANVCACQTESDPAFCARLGKNCGPVTAPDNCGAGRTVGSCGQCAGVDSCGAVAPGVCGCAAETDLQLCGRLGKNCGTISATDNCNQARPAASCGSCAPGDTCSAFVQNVCGCIPESDPAFCTRLGKNCDSVTAPDNCGASRTVASCGPACVGPQTCGAVTPNVCGCVGETDQAFCTRLGKVCGPASGTDNCNQARSVTDCGSCTAPQNASPVCTAGGTCDFSCNGGYHRCSNACCQSTSAISAGNLRTCSLDTAGQVLCWGAPPIGDGTTSGDTLLPKLISGVAGVTVVRASAGFACASGTGGLYCWGTNAEGKLGDNSTTPRPSPVPVVGFAGGASQLSLGQSHSCAVDSSGALKCWGLNDVGQVGDGSGLQRNAPVPVTGLSSGVAQVATGYRHSCAVLTDGGVRCWGHNFWGQIGDGSTGSNRLSPVDVVGLPSASAAVVAGDSYSCALVSPPGSVWCWGANFYGQLGDNTTTYHPTPAQVAGLNAGVVRLSAGTGHVCAVTDVGAAFCWGRNTYAQLGDGSGSNQLVPVGVIGLDAGTATISAGENHTCALRTDGVALCWGANSAGQLGTGNTSPQPTPTPVSGL